MKIVQSSKEYSNNENIIGGGKLSNSTLNVNFCAVFQHFFFTFSQQKVNWTF